MARTTTTASNPKAPVKTARKPISIATAEQADGALQTEGRSAYEICGIRETVYREKSFAAYQAKLKSMDLIELQDHSYELGVLPSQSIDTSIERLETKWLRENPHAREEIAAARAISEENETLAQKAERILARGR